MTIDFSAEPYFDDFSKNKHFHRILFKPGRAVQARELTQLQTIVQDQISSFANHVFSQNTPVSGGKITVDRNRKYLRLNDTIDDVAIDVNDFLNRIITNSTGIKQAVVIGVQEPDYNDDGTIKEYPTLVISQLADIAFKANEIIVSADDDNLKAKIFAGNETKQATGKAATAHISDGIFYVINGYSYDSEQNPDGTYTKYSIGNFVSVQSQNVIISTYNNTPTGRIGLVITETIYDYIDDNSLLDPALGSSNFQAPGADRYVILLNLTMLDMESPDDSNFIELVRIDEGIIKKQVDSTVYSTIDEYFAKRTYDTNGDYVVDDFKLDSKAAPDANNFILGVGPGLAYVRGYRAENQSNLDITLPRARTFATEDKKDSVTIDYGSYLIGSNVHGTFSPASLPEVEFHCVKKSSIDTSNRNRTKVGTGRLFQFSPKTISGNATDYTYQFYVTDIETETITASIDVSNIAGDVSTKQIKIVSTNTSLSSVDDTYNECTVILSTGESFRVVDYTGATKTFTLDRNPAIIPESGATLKVFFDIRDTDSIILVESGNIVAYSDIAQEGKIPAPALDAGYTILNDPGFPELIEKIEGGNRVLKSITCSGYNINYLFNSINSTSIGSNTLVSIAIESGYNTALVFLGTIGTLSSDEKQKYTLIIKSKTSGSLNAGEIVPISVITSAVITNGTSITFTIPSSYVGAGSYFDIIAPMNVYDAENTNKIRKTKTLVTASTTTCAVKAGTSLNSANTFVDLSKGHVLYKNAPTDDTEISLYVCDVKRIVKIIDTQLPNPTDAEITTLLESGGGIDVTSYYDFDNGQRDCYYDHASIKLKPAAPNPDGAILALFDYYQHSTSTDGYFSLASYESNEYAEIPVYKAKSGESYNLRDCLDYRPVRVNAVQTFSINSTKAPFIPLDQSTFSLEQYEYYLGRKDLLVLKQDKTFFVQSGTPALVPEFPKQAENSLLLAKISLDPYTTYIPEEAVGVKVPGLFIEPVAHKRWTMSDISDLQTRVNNIEYYTSLSLLEQSAQSLQITDANGLNRFKNGILADDFSSFFVADINNKNYNACINRVDQKLLPRQIIANLQLQDPNAAKLTNNSAFTSYKIHTTGVSKIFSAYYTNKECVKQHLASGAININPFSVISESGSMLLDPSIDNWLDDAMPPAVSVAQNAISFEVNANSVSDPKKTSPKLDVIIQPYIRPQDILFKCNGMSKNCPVNAYFDGVNVSDHIIIPDRITLINCQNFEKLSELDVLGVIEGDVATALFTVIKKDQKSPSATDKYILQVAGNYISTENYSTNKLYKFIWNPDNNVVDIVKTKNNSICGELNSASADTVQRNNILVDVYDAGVQIYRIKNIVPLSSCGPFGREFGIWTTKNGSGLSIEEKTYTFKSNSYKGESTRKYYIRTVYNNSMTGYLSIKKSGGSTTYYVLGTSASALLNSSASSSDGKTFIKKNNFDYEIILDNDSSYEIKFQVTSTTLTNNYFGFAVGAHPFNNWGMASPSVEKLTAQWGTTPKGTTTYKDIVFSTASLPPVDRTHVKELSNGGLYFNNINYLYLRDGTGLTRDKLINIRASIKNLINSSGEKLGSEEIISAIISDYDPSTLKLTFNSNVRYAIGVSSIGDKITEISSIVDIKGYKIKAISDVTDTVKSLLTDNTGSLTGIFSVPEGKFKVGERTFRIDNRINESEPKSASTYAEAVFTGGLVNVANRKNQDSFIRSSVKNSVIQTDDYTNITAIQGKNLNDPIAQTFMVESTSYPKGVMLSTITLFFKTKPNAKSSVTLKLVGTENGFPHGQVIPGGLAVLDWDDVKISNAPQYKSTGTTIKFDYPVYIEPDKMYAFILETKSSEFNVYYAAKDGTVLESIVTENTFSKYSKIGSVPYVGSLFETQNSQNWMPDFGKALMMKIECCEFNLNSPTIPLVVNKLTAKKNIMTEFNYLSDNEDSYLGQYNKKLEVHAFNVAVNDFVPPATTIDYKINTLLSDEETYSGLKSIMPGKNSFPADDEIYLNDGKGERVMLPRSNNSFTLNAVLSTQDKFVSPLLYEQGTSVYAIQWDINDLELNDNSLVLKSGGSGYTANAALNISAPDILGGIQAYANIAIKSGVVSSISWDNKGSGYLNPPTVTITDTSTPTSNAVINVVSEFNPNGGNALCRYLTKPVTLVSGNDSKDLRVYYTGYRPKGSEIYVFYRLKSVNDSQSIETSHWQLMTNIGSVRTAYSTQRSELFEFEAAPGTDGVATGFITYKNKNNKEFKDFIQFQVKIVMTTNDKTNVPFLTNLRAIALPSYSGM